MDEMLPRWLVHSSGTHVGDPVPVGGKLRVSFLGGVAEDAGELSLAESQFAYDLRGESVRVRMERVDTAWASNLEVRVPDDGMAIGMGTRGADLTAWTFTSRDRGGCATQDDIDSIDRRFLVGDILVGVAVAGAGAAVLFYWLGDGKEEERSVDVVAPPSSAALAVGGRF